MTNWESMSTQELKARLKTELAVEAPDRETVNGIVEELEKREPVKEIPVELVVAWEQRKEKKKPKASRWKPVWKAAVAAVLAVALLGIIPSALGMGNIFETVGKWTKDIFAFGDTKNEGYVFQTDHPGLQELYDTVSELGVTQNVVPTWLPEGFQAKSIKQGSSPKGITVYAVFVNENSEIQMTFDICSEIREVVYQKDEDRVEVWEHEGSTIYILENEEKYCAMWQTENIECAIYSDTKEYIYKIIDSIC